MMRLFVELLGAFVGSALVGVFSYGAVKWIRKLCPYSSGEVFAVFVWFPHLLILCVVWMVYVPMMLVGALICLGAAVAEGKVAKEERSFGFHYSTVLTASALSCTLGTVPLSLCGVLIGAIGIVACVLGLLLGASTLPVFVWMFRSSQLRPGVDRPFHPHESLPDESVEKSD